MSASTGADVIKVLFLAANPSGSTNRALEEELRAIDVKIRGAEHRDRLHLLSHWPVRLDDLARILQRHKPQVVHFSGYGAESGAIVLVGANGKPKEVPPEALSDIFRVLKDNVRVVLLNACYSAAKAKALAKVIDCVVGMTDEIYDDDALAFAAEFYQDLAFGRSVQDAFDLGLARLKGEGVAEPKELVKLHQKRGLKPADIVLVEATELMAGMPFRPYRRFVSQTFSLKEYQTHLHETLQSANTAETELRFLGGRAAVLASIWRHMRSFDPAEAQTPYAPAWAALKPILVRAGLTVGDDTTLTDIKAFLDATPTTAQQEANMAPTSNKVFVVHGHAEDMKQAAARTLTALDLDPIILHEQPNQGRTIIEKFEESSDVGFAVVLLSPDDMAYPAGVEHKKAKPRPRARQNVVMELGFFLAKLGRDHVFPLYKQADDFELPSDFQGVVYTPYDAGGSWRFALAQELKAAKYDVDANKLLRT